MARYAALISFVLLWGVQAQAKTEFSCMLWESHPYSEIFYKNGEDMVPLELIPDRRSKLYEIANMEFLELYVSQEKPDGSMEMKLVGKRAIPPKVERALFVLKHRQQNKELPIAIIGVNDSLAVFPPGSFRIVNFTGQELSFSIGDKSQNLKPRKLQVIKPDLPEKGGLVSLVVSDKDGKPVFGRRLFGQSRSRQMVFVLVDEDAKHGIKAKLLPDILSAE